MDTAQEQQMLSQIASLAGAINLYKQQQERKKTKRALDPNPPRPIKKQKKEPNQACATESEKALMAQIASLAGKINKHKQKTEAKGRTCKYSFSRKRYVPLQKLRRRGKTAVSLPIFSSPMEGVQLKYIPVSAMRIPLHTFKRSKNKTLVTVRGVKVANGHALVKASSSASMFARYSTLASYCQTRQQFLHFIAVARSGRACTVHGTGDKRRLTVSSLTNLVC